MGDRDRTCIILICNQLPSLSAHTHIVWYQELGSNQPHPVLQTGALPTELSWPWRKAEESNPIPFLRTQFSRLVGAPTHLHHFPIIWHTPKDSNLDKRFWRPLCCHYIRDTYLVETTGVEPVVPEGRRIYSPLGLPIFLHLQICMVGLL